MEDPELARLIAGAPDWPTPDELREMTPSTPPPLDDTFWPDSVAELPVAEMPVDPVPSGWSALDLDVATTDPRTLSDAQLIDMMSGFGRTAAWAQARQARLVAEFDRRRAGSAARYTPDEVALALSMSRFSAMGLLERSRRLVDTLHATLTAYETGRIDGFTTRVICDAVRYLDDAQAEWVQDQVIDHAPRQSVAQLRAALARAVIAVDTDGANERHRRARKDRRVGVGQEQDGMATVWAALAAQDAAQVFGTLTGLARSLGPDDPRGMDARRADLLVGLMTGEISIAYPDPGSPDPDSEGGAAGPGETESTDSHDSDRPGDSHDNGEYRLGSENGTGDNGTVDTREIDTGQTGPARSHEPRSHEPRCDGAGETDTGTTRNDAGDGMAGRDQTGQSTTVGTSAVGRCPVCAAQAWRASRPRLRPVNPTKPLVQIVIGHSTLRGTDHAPAELVGYGAIGAEQAREITADAVWKRLVHDDLTGVLLDHGRRTYRPPAALADHIRARDVYCRSPLCRRRAIDSELDHTIAYPHGPTAEPNLAAVCLLHHDEKHAPGWTVLQHPDGRIDWTTPTGHVYSSEVHDYRPLPPPPLPSIPGPIADRTQTQPVPVPAATPARIRSQYDWTSSAETTVPDDVEAPF